MKYYLLVGYQTIEKFREFAKIQIYLNNRLLEEFICNETKTINNIFHNTAIEPKTDMLDTLYHSKQPKIINIKKNGKTRFIAEKHYKIWHGRGWQLVNTGKKVSNYKVYGSQPKKIKVFELDAKEFSSVDINHIKIKIVGGPSNNTNGFVSKRNMVVIFPIFLIPKFCFDLNLLNRLFDKMKKNFCQSHQCNSYPFYIKKKREPQPKKDGTFFLNDTPIQWPGPNYIPKEKNSKNCFLLGEPIGNDCEIDLFVHKKHKIHMIHTTSDTPKGKWQFNLCFLNLYEKLIKRNVKKFGKWNQRFVNLQQFEELTTKIETNDLRLEQIAFDGIEPDK